MSKGRNRWLVGGLVLGALLLVGIVVQAGLAVAELFADLSGGPTEQAAPAEPTSLRTSGRRAASVRGTTPGAALAPSGQAGAPPTKILPLVARPATARTGEIDPEPDSDALRRLALRRAARERWRATQSPEELEERRRRQEERRATRPPEQQALRQEQREYKRTLIDGALADPEGEQEPPLDEP